eukprot:m.298881 g.298881  ORF g.298881 m.298881 type:complete len:382 (+) comp15866_c0_seq10:34-1179(+)
MEALFDKAQRNAATHAKALDAMLVLYSKHAEVEEDMPFFGQFIDMFNRALIVFKREPAVERTIDFCVQFVARVADSEAETAEDQASSEISFLNAFLKHLIAASKAKDKAVRFRSCQAVCKLLNALSEDAEIDDEIWDDLQRSMLTRTQDKIPVVRVHAIGALGRLQDQNTAECPVVQAYISLLTCDSSPDVRRAALTQILIDEYTVDFVLSRARDRKDAVRKCLYETLTVKVDVASLQIEQRNMLVRTGLTDRAPEVVKACSNMICRGWYESCNKDAVEVLDLMDVETAVKDSDMLAQALLKTGTHNKENYKQHSPAKAAGISNQEHVDNVGTQPRSFCLGAAVNRRALYKYYRLSSSLARHFRPTVPFPPPPSYCLPSLL